MPPTEEADPRIEITLIPSSGPGYILAVHADASGNVINKFDVLEAPPMDFPEGLDSPEMKTVQKEVTLGDALRYVARRVDEDLKDVPHGGVLP